ncbi:MAG: hypothetical protein K6B75_08795 [Lachnospiraceae bacterium]|nr:hypothetical protein [Lachnospiraceae bacterium]
MSNTILDSFKEKLRLKNILMMLVSVFFMGVSVALLNLTDFGPDPFSALNYAICTIFNIDLGPCELVVNVALIVVLFIADKTLFGPGTIGNMVIVGYAADFTKWLVFKLFPELTFDSLSLRIIVMIPAFIVFLIAAALYMNSKTGTSPYDAASFFIYNKVSKNGERKITFRLVRIIYDALVTLLAVGLGFIGGKQSVGIMTILMVFALGPAVDLVGSLLNKNKKN